MSKKLEEYTKEELIEIIKDLKSRKKFGLVWEDKPEKVALQCDVELPVLEEVTTKAIEKLSGAPTNYIIEGDNYHALSVLNYTHAGKVDVIYIDPPYNTGNKDFIYNDNYVDKEDTFRHSKWLSFMTKRLQLAWNLLSESTGIIFMSIGEDEYAQLKMLSDTIFGEEAYVGDAVWQSRKSVSNDTIMSVNHNYTLIYAKNKDEILRQSKLGSLFRNKVDPKKFENPDNDPRGPWTADPFDAPNIRPNLTYEIKNPNNGKVYMPPNGRCWRTTQREYERLLADGRIVFGKTGNSKPQQKRFLNEIKEKGTAFTSIWNDVGTTTSGSNELKKMFGFIPFNNPKPTSLIRKIINASLVNNNGLILDFFAGSGTTGHATMQLNHEDGGNRCFIMVTNNEGGIATNVTYPRIAKVVEGYSDVPAMPANIRYFTTSFVSKEQTDDQTRAELVARSTDMICLREDTFEKVLDTKLFKVFCDTNHYTAIIFDSEAIGSLKDALAKLQDDKPIHIYIFSLSNDTYESDFGDLERSYELRPIPESILEVYRRIFISQNRTMGEYD